MSLRDLLCLHQILSRISWQDHNLVWCVIENLCVSETWYVSARYCHWYHGKIHNLVWCVIEIVYVSETWYVSARYYHWYRGNIQSNLSKLHLYIYKLHRYINSTFCRPRWYVCYYVLDVNEYYYTDHSLYSILKSTWHNYLAPGGGCEVLFSPGLSVCLSVCVCVCLSVCLCICVSGQYFGILFLGYLKRYRSEIYTGYLYGCTQFTKINWPS